MNTEFVFYDEGVEKKGNLVIALNIKDEKYILYEIEENKNSDFEDIICVGKYLEEKDVKLLLDSVTDVELEKIRNRINIIIDELQ